MKDIVKLIVNRLKTIRKKVSIPIVSDLRISFMTYNFHKKFNKKENFKNKSIKNKVEEFKNKAEMFLFDISTCKYTLF